MMHINRQYVFSQHTFTRRKESFILLLTGLTMGLALTIVMAVCLGTVKIVPEEACRILLYKLFHLTGNDILGPISAIHTDIIWKIRLPRVLLAVIAGAGLAACGTVMQASVQNPLADPYILGIAAGASLGATFSILLTGAGAFAGLGTAFWAFVGALAACLLVLALAGIGGRLSTVKMILAGTIASALFSALASCIIYLAGNAEGIRTVTFWTMGSLAAAKWSGLALPALGVVLGCFFFLIHSRQLNILLLGEEAATTLGIDLAKVRRRNLIVTALITGLIVAACGVIGFVGLIIPHIVRGFVGSDHRRLLPASILVGALFLTWADVLARSVLASGELPIGIITALSGAPFFLYILCKSSFGFTSK
ncbi:FecCD family ABC transporter permease [Sporomusa aerivorans]|uniref:FecCD family ABC transporter permease n=1 Tax=Sporomusa aerivorans TaxID=204936 RepID=UPI00352A8370